MPLLNNSPLNHDSDFEASFASSLSNSEDTHLIDIEESIEIEVLPSQQLIAVTHDPLNAVLEYRLNGEGNNSLAQEIGKGLGLGVIAASGVIFYYIPIKVYVEALCTDPAYKNIPCDFFVINHQVGTLVVAGTILINATNAYLNQQKAASIPLKLVSYLKYPLSAKQKTAQKIMTFAGSLIASMPFPVLSIVNSIPGSPTILIISQAFVVWMTNTFLHLLPVDLAFRNPLYRLPFLPIEFIVQKTSNARLSVEEKQEKKLQAQINQHYQAIKRPMMNHFNLALKLLSIYGFSFSGCHYTNAVKNDIRDIKESNYQRTPLQFLTELFNRLHQMSPDRTIPSSGRINEMFRGLAYVLGASGVISSCAGFWGGTFNEMNEITGSPLSGAIISAPSIYCFGVLLAFFGGNALQNSYDYLTTWKDDSVKIPMAFKLYPKTSVLLILISMYLSAFSYAAGAQLINDNFNGKLEFLRPYLLDLAKTGLTFLGFTAMIDFFNNLLSKFAQYGGGEDTQTVVKLYEALSQLINSIGLMKSDMLMASLSNMEVEPLKSIFNIRQEKDREELKHPLSQLKVILKEKFFKESALYEKSRDADDELIKRLYQLKDGLDLTSNRIETLLTDFDKELRSDLKEVCREYVAVLKVIDTLEKINLVNDSELGHSARNNDDGYAGTSSETTPLLPPRAAGSIHSNFFHPSPSHRYYDDRVSSLSPTTLLQSNQMGV